jgi:hypothetical protein
VLGEGEAGAIAERESVRFVKACKLRAAVCQVFGPILDLKFQRSKELTDFVGGSLLSKFIDSFGKINGANHRPVQQFSDSLVPNFQAQ